MKLNVTRSDHANQARFEGTLFCTGRWLAKAPAARLLGKWNVCFLRQKSPLNSPSHGSAADERKFKRVNWLDIIETVCASKETLSRTCNGKAAESPFLLQLFCFAHSGLW